MEYGWKGGWGGPMFVMGWFRGVWFGRAKPNPSHTICSYTFTYSKSDFPTKFHTNCTIIALLWWFLGRKPGLGGLNIAPAIPYAGLVKLILN